MKSDNSTILPNNLINNNNNCLTSKLGDFCFDSVLITLIVVLFIAIVIALFILFVLIYCTFKKTPNITKTNDLPLEECSGQYELTTHPNKEEIPVPSRQSLTGNSDEISHQTQLSLRPSNDVTPQRSQLSLTPNNEEVVIPQPEETNNMKIRSPSPFVYFLRGQRVIYSAKESPLSRKCNDSEFLTYI